MVKGPGGGRTKRGRAGAETAGTERAGAEGAGGGASGGTGRLTAGARGMRAQKAASLLVEELNEILDLPEGQVAWVEGPSTLRCCA